MHGGYPPPQSGRQPPPDARAPGDVGAWAGGAPAQEAPATDEPSTAQMLRGTLKEVLQIVPMAVTLAVLTHIFLAQATVVHGQSMQPNLRPTERLIVEKLRYYFHPPRHNEIVMLDLPDVPALLIKRVIGLPGETVEIQGGRVFVDGREVASPTEIAPRLRIFVGGDEAEPSSKFENSDAVYGPITLAKDTYFVLGDNRNNSNDSRAFGPVHRDVIKGRVWVRYWPLTRFTIFH